MKSCIWTIVFLWCCNLLAIAQTKYEVTANTFLNIRSHASTDAPIVGTIDKGGEVEVYEIMDGWAKIRYNDDYAYVSAQYLKKTESNAPVSISTKKWFDFSSKPLGKGNVKWMVFVIAGLSLILFFMGKAREDDKPLEEGLYGLNIALFLIVSILEIVYVILMGGNAIWFCLPDKVGWIWTIINFILFGCVVANQISCLMETLSDIAAYNADSGWIDIRWGVFSLIGGVIGSIVCAIIFPPGILLVGLAFIICQIIQIILLFKRIVPYGGWGSAFLYLTVFVIGSLATLLILIHFIVLLIIVLVALFILYLVSKFSSQSSNRCCKTCRHYSGGFCYDRGCYISDAGNKICNNYS